MITSEISQLSLGIDFVIVPGLNSTVDREKDDMISDAAYCYQSAREQIHKVISCNKVQKRCTNNDVSVESSLNVPTSSVEISLLETILLFKKIS
jgi:hypothetical protein